MNMPSNPLHHPDYAILAALIKSVREESGVTQLELAERLGMEQSTISKIERRERRVDVTELRRICIALGVSFREFISNFECAITEGEGIGRDDK